MGILRTIRGWFAGRQRSRTRRKLAETFARKLDEQVSARRRSWDAEDSELRSAMAAVAGFDTSKGSSDLSGLLSKMGLAPRRDMATMADGRISGRFDSATTTDDNRLHWAMADALAADAAASPGIRYTLRNRARYECHNNCYARGVGESIANDFVGTGPRLHIDDSRFPEDVQADIEAKFAAWTAAINLPAKLRTMRKARRQDGETFGLKITNPKLAHPVKLDLKVIEADRVRFVDINLLLVPSVDGIRYDDYGNPVSYHVLRVHPGFWSYATGFVGFPWEYDVWQADRVIHWYRQDRPEQHRGLPEFLAALPLYATLRRFTQATLDAAETAADFAVLLHTQAGANDAELVAPFSSVPLERRMIVALPDSYEASQMKPEHPATTYPQFKREIIAEIGRCENVPYNVVAADSSNSNFASGQLDYKIYFRTRDIERSEANLVILESLFRDWLSEAALIESGPDGKPYLPKELRTREATLGHSWHWDSNELGDPLKLAAAKSTMLKSGLATIPELYAAKGQDWVKAFAAQARAMGISFEELQGLVRTSTYAVGPGQPDQAEDDESDEGGESGTPKPGQAATQKETA